MTINEEFAACVRKLRLVEDMKLPNLNESSDHLVEIQKAVLDDRPDFTRLPDEFSQKEAIEVSVDTWKQHMLDWVGKANEKIAAMQSFVIQSGKLNLRLMERLKAAGVNLDDDDTDDDQAHPSDPS